MDEKTLEILFGTDDLTSVSLGFLLCLTGVLAKRLYNIVYGNNDNDNPFVKGFWSLRSLSELLLNCIFIYIIMRTGVVFLNPQYIIIFCFIVGIVSDWIGDYIIQQSEIKIKEFFSSIDLRNIFKRNKDE